MDRCQELIQQILHIGAPPLPGHAGTPWNREAAASGTSPQNYETDPRAEKIFGSYGAWSLFFSASTKIARFTVVFFLLFINTVFFSPKSEDALVAHCDTLPGADWVHFCTITKVFARSFPLMAVCAAVWLAGRAVVRKYIWAKFLRIGIVLDYDNILAVKDPIVLIMVIEFLLASSHFIIFIYPLNRWDNFEGSVHKFTFPAFAFLFLFFLEYDIEAQLLPLNKYCEQDPVHAKEMMRRLQIIREGVLVKKLRALPGFVGSASGELDDTLRTFKGLDLREDRHKCCWCTPCCTTSDFWPTKILLNPDLKGENTFKILWYIYSTFAFVCAFLTICGFAEDLAYSLKKWATSREGADLPRIICDSCHILVVLVVMGTWSHGLLRLRARTKRPHEAREALELSFS